MIRCSTAIFALCTSGAATIFRSHYPKRVFRGDYLVDIYPYLIGPVREGPGCLEQRASLHRRSIRGLIQTPPLEYAGQLRAMEDQERELTESANYERVVLWFEHDRTDQLSLIHLLGHYAIHPKPPRLELIAIGDFPGSRRFIGLGETTAPKLCDCFGQREDQSPLRNWNWARAPGRALASPDPRASWRR